MDKRMASAGTLTPNQTLQTLDKEEKYQTDKENSYPKMQACTYE
jgi:hypothetical protein